MLAKRNRRSSFLGIVYACLMNRFLVKKQGSSSYFDLSPSRYLTESWGDCQHGHIEERIVVGKYSSFPLNSFTKN